MKRRLWPHALVLWCLAPCLVLVATHRPAGGDRGRAARLSKELGPFRFVESFEITESIVDSLGTPDAAWRRYASPAGEAIVVAVFHDENWKSVHAPDTCLRGSNMTVVEDAGRTLATSVGSFEVGRLRPHAPDSGQDYLSLFAYVAPPAFVTGSYWSFFLHHAPRAVVRSSLAGCLLRVETWVGQEDPAVAEARCAELLALLIPAALEELR